MLKRLLLALALVAGAVAPALAQTCDWPNSPSVGDTVECGGATWRFGKGWDPAGALGPGVVSETFSASGTYTAPAGARYFQVFAWGSASGGDIEAATFTPAEMGATASVTIGDGAGSPTNTTFDPVGTGSTLTAAGQTGLDGKVVVIAFLGESYGDGTAQYYRAKGADETTSSDTTLSDDAELTFDVNAGATYKFRFIVFYDTPAAADFKYSVTCPASPALVSITTKSIAPGATTQAITRQSACGFGPTAITETSGTDGYIEIEGVVQNGANAGSIAFQWAQNSSSGTNTTVRKGSVVEYVPIQ